MIITDAVWLEQLPSHLAAAALCLAQQMVNEGSLLNKVYRSHSHDRNEFAGQSCWDRTIEFYSGYTAEELMPTMSFMAYCMQISGTGRLVVMTLW